MPLTLELPQLDETYVGRQTASPRLSDQSVDPSLLTVGFSGADATCAVTDAHCNRPPLSQRYSWAPYLYSHGGGLHLAKMRHRS